MDEDNMGVWFTSDTHFGHENILRLSGRPFDNIHDHDETLIANWNARVSSHDDVWHLGDVSLDLDNKKLIRLFERLNGQKHLIIGNHDTPQVVSLPWASQPMQMREIIVDNFRVVLCHFALRSWWRIRSGTLHLYGHTHGTLSGTRHSEDVGVDAWGYAPVALPEILPRMAENLTIEEELQDYTVFSTLLHQSRPD